MIIFSRSSSSVSVYSLGISSFLYFTGSFFFFFRSYTAGSSSIQLANPFEKIYFVLPLSVLPPVFAVFCGVVSLLLVFYRPTLRGARSSSKRVPRKHILSFTSSSHCLFSRYLDCVAFEKYFIVIFIIFHHTLWDVFLF